MSTENENTSEGESEKAAESEEGYTSQTRNANTEDAKEQPTQSEDTTAEKTDAEIGSGEKSGAAKKGIGWFVAAMFILGDLVGGGVVAMPAAFVETGLVLGILFMVVICAIFVTTGWLLADTWDIMRERWPEYRGHCRKPFPEMALRSVNRATKIATQVLVYATLFGASVVYVLLSSKIFQNFLANFDVHINFCYLLIVVSAAVLPVTFLKSPADFWWAILIAVMCTIAAIVMIFVGVSLDLQACYPEANHPTISVKAILSLGIFLFAFNGHQVFPTVQNDMHHPTDFKKSVVVGFIFTALLYMPLSVYSYLVYGDSMIDSVIDSIQTGWIRYVADMSIAMHCILTIIITVNPINLQLEDTFNVPHKFCFKRVVVRTSLMVVILFVGLSLPNFGAVMNLFGSTTIPCTCVILPTLFHIYIKAANYDEETDTWIKPTFLEALRNTPKFLLATLFIINVITVICSLISTAMSIKEITGVQFTPPCYVLPFLTHKRRSRLDADILNCCGKFVNISRYNVQCSARTYVDESYISLKNSSHF